MQVSTGGLFFMKIALVIGLVLLGAAAVNASTIAPTGKPKNWPANPGKHTIDIQRTATSARQLYMIQLAESTYPPRDEVVKQWNTKPIPEDAKLWWYGEDNIKYPYAITKQAIDCYTNFVVSRQTKSISAYNEPKTELTYHASADFLKSYTARDDRTFSNVFVVSIKMDFGLGNDWGLWFTKEREVIINADGKVLKIYGDGATDIILFD